MLAVCVFRTDYVSVVSLSNFDVALRQVAQKRWCQDDHQLAMNHCSGRNEHSKSLTQVNTAQSSTFLPGVQVGIPADFTEQRGHRSRHHRTRCCIFGRVACDTVVEQGPTARLCPYCVENLTMLCLV
jgi:hypothetical protein